jgi:uridine phosphorylase
VPDQEDKDSCLEPSLLTASKLIEWQRRSRRIDSVPACILLTHQASLFRALTPRFGRRRRALLARTSLLPSTNGRVAIAGGFGVGAPSTAMAVEELSALGAKTIVAVDVVAGLIPELNSGAVLLPAEAICAEGTSPHYAPGQEFTAADAGMQERLRAALDRRGIAVASGRVWSTDAPLRETADEVASYRAQGAVAVDMETAALFASARALGLAAASVLVVADTLAGKWRPPPDSRLVAARLRDVARAVIECLRA